MKAKNIFSPTLAPFKTGAAVVAILLMSISCSQDFLNVVPLDRIDKTSFYSTANQVIIGVNGVYASQRNDFGNANIFALQEARSDNAQLNPNGQAEQISLDSFNDTPGNLLVLDGWTNMYNTIALANAVIQNGPKASGDAALIARAVGEAKFLRAVTYFQLVQLWGGVPLRTAIVDLLNSSVGRATPAEIYAQIAIDCADASNVLPTGYSGAVNSEVGRATKWAALTLLGKVELQRGNKTAAEAALRQVLGKYTLMPNYGDIHKAGNDNKQESIFEVNFSPSNQTGLGLPSVFVYQSEMTRLGIAAPGINQPSVIPTTDMMNAYEAGDLRKNATVAVAVVENKPYIKKYLDPAAAAVGHDINLVVLRYADVLLSLAEAIGETPEAYGYINQVRARAGLGTISGATAGTFIDKVMKERRVEFAFEQWRWYDLLRLPSAQVVSIMAAQLAAQQGVTVSVTANDLLYPIPQTEIDVAKGIVVQNPGY